MKLVLNVIWLSVTSWLLISILIVGLRDPIDRSDLSRPRRIYLFFERWSIYLMLCLFWPLTLPMTLMARHDARRRLGYSKRGI